MSTPLSVLRRARVVLPAAIGSALLLSACTSPIESTPQLSRYGAVEIIAKSTSATTAVANATVIFFNGYQVEVPNSSTMTRDQCIFAANDTTTQIAEGSRRAGDNVGLSIGTNNLTLPFDALLTRYATPENAPFQYQAGQSAQVAIAGADTSFPAAAIGVKLSEPIVPVAAIPAAGQPLVITWNGTNDPTSVVLAHLRYANPSSTAYPNEQIFCQLTDDGRYELPASALTAFLVSPNNRRSLMLRRYRTNELVIDARTLVHIASYADSTVRF